MWLMDDLKGKQRALASLIGEANRIVVFSGAGISTECGIPDFRSPGGVWERFRPLDFKTFMLSEEARREGLTRFLKIRDEVGPVTPGRGHKAAASWHAQGKLAGVITQNIDGLHQAAGVPVSKVVELHGNGTYAHCLSCGTRHELDWIAEQLDAHPGAPSCTACGGIVKTATISFGQPMPEDEMRRAERLTRECDLFLAVGSSLVVEPAASFPVFAARLGVPLVIINRDPTPADGLADLVVRDDIGTVLEPYTEG
jgi:NAD-dependent deacetylase